jgi:hypothetical protein
MTKRIISWTIVSAVFASIAATLLLELIGVENVAGIAGGISGGVAGAVGASMASKRKEPS